MVMEHHPRNRRGFTLIELLVTITIIATLAALSLVAFRSVRDSAKQTVCASNLRNIGIAMQLHAQDNQGYYPDTSHTAADGQSWIYQLETYLGDFEETRICPADPKATLRRTNRSSSYILNSLVFMPPLDAFGEPDGPAFNRPDRLPDPSRTILVFIASDRAGLYPGDDHTHSDQWQAWPRVLRDIAPDRHKNRASKDSTKGTANYLYADGRVATLHASEVKSKIQKSINIAEIPGIVR